MGKVISITHKGDFSKTDKFLKHLQGLNFLIILEEYGKRGVEALRAATPVDSGLTADSWSYQVDTSNGKISISWLNSNVNDGVNIAILLQYDHFTRTGGFVKGQDYINPAIQPVFDEIEEKVWKEVIDK